jgi:hypothetical protein
LTVLSKKKAKRFRFPINLITFAHRNNILTINISKNYAKRKETQAPQDGYTQA